MEAPLDLPAALLRARHRPVLVDCLTLWLSNLILGERDLEAAAVALETALAQRSAPVVLVSNEVGLGIVPVIVMSALGVSAWAVALSWLAFCLIAAGADAAAAGNPQSLRVDRRVPPRARLGERVDTHLWLTNTGSRRVRALVRDA